MTDKILLTIFISLFSISTYAKINVDCGYNRIYEDVKDLKYLPDNRITFIAEAWLMGKASVTTSLGHCAVEESE